MGRYKIINGKKVYLEKRYISGDSATLGSRYTWELPRQKEESPMDLLLKKSNKNKYQE